MFALIRALHTRFGRPPRTERPHITALVGFGAAVGTIILVVIALRMLAP